MKNGCAYGLALWIALGLAVFAARSAEGQTLTVLYNFTGSPDGAAPVAGVVRDSEGNLYGTTLVGGNNSGTVFEVSANGTETILHSFRGKRDGSEPWAGLVRDPQGNLYGTTAYGGAFNFGVVFEVTKAGKERVLYSFAGLPDGQHPMAGLVRDAAGNFYGTTSAGGGGNCNYGAGCGTVFMLSNTGTETVLHSFAGGTMDGASPVAGLVRDASGNLYGTTYGGGASGLGTVFKVDPPGQETVLYSFAGYPTDGENPAAGLIWHAGNLYGTTSAGGAYSYGTVFRVTKTGRESVLYSFGGTSSDGRNPAAGLVGDAVGNLYGTTQAGGGTVCAGEGCGTLFKLTKRGKETVLCAFAAGNDASIPLAGVILDAEGNLYGTTSNGGTARGPGTLFKLTP
jgi:uncharacterized repeat protein (TIGR03803 family)